MKQRDLDARVRRLSTIDPDVGVLFDELAATFETELNRSLATAPKERRMISSIARPTAGARLDRPEKHEPGVTLEVQESTADERKDGKLVTAFDGASADRVYKRRTADIAPWRGDIA